MNWMSSFQSTSSSMEVLRGATVGSAGAAGGTAGTGSSLDGRSDPVWKRGGSAGGASSDGGGEWTSFVFLRRNATMARRKGPWGRNTQGWPGNKLCFARHDHLSDRGPSILGRDLSALSVTRHAPCYLTIFDAAQLNTHPVCLRGQCTESASCVYNVCWSCPACDVCARFRPTLVRLLSSSFAPPGLV